MDVVYLFRILGRKKWYILSFALLSALSTFILVTNQKDQYESIAQYSTGFTSEKVKLSDGSVAVDIYTLDLKFNNVIETFKSPKVIGTLSYKLMVHDLLNPEKAYRRLTLKQKQLPEFKAIEAAQVLKILRNKLDSSELLSSSVEEENKVLNYLKLYEYNNEVLKKVLVIRRIERTDYLEIIYQSEHPELSAYVVNTLGYEFLNYYKNLYKTRNTESAVNIQQMLDVQQRKVDSLTGELKIARVSQGALDPVEQTKSAMETVKDLQMELSTSQSEYNLQSRLYESYRERIEELNRLLGGNKGGDVLALLKKKDEIREQISTSNDPDPALQRELNNIEQQIRRLSGMGNNRQKLQDNLSEFVTKSSEAKARMNAASASISQLSKQINASRNIGNISPKTQVEIDAIGRTLEIENGTLKSIKEKVYQAEGLIRDDPTENFRQTLIGEPHFEPVPKRKILKSGLAGISVLAILSLIFIIMDLSSSAVKLPSAFRNLVKLNTVGLLNRIALKKYTIEDLMLNDFEGKQYSDENYFKNNIRKLRNEFDLTGKQVFLFTSTQEKVGKTLLLKSLAYSFLLNKKKVLIIDLNFGNNALTQVFKPKYTIENVLENRSVKVAATTSSYVEKSNSSGSPFSEYEFGLSEGPEVFYKWHAVFSSTQENLHVLGCENTSRSPTEVFAGGAFDDFLAEMKKEFHYILIEAGALNNRSDSYELMPFVQSVVTVFSANVPLTQTDIKAIDALEKLDKKNFGAVLNLVETENINF